VVFSNQADVVSAIEMYGRRKFTSMPSANQNLPRWTTLEGKFTLILAYPPPKLKKGLAIIANPSISMVGGAGIEPATSTM